MGFLALPLSSYFDGHDLGRSGFPLGVLANQTNLTVLCVSLFLQPRLGVGVEEALNDVIKDWTLEVIIPLHVTDLFFRSLSHNRLRTVPSQLLWRLSQLQIL